MRILPWAAALLFCSSAIAVAAPLTDQDKAAQDFVDAVDRLIEVEEARMSPAEKRKFDRDVQASAYAEMQSVAKGCGTSLRITSEPKIEDRHVYVQAGSTQEQLACVRARLPFVEADPTS